MYLPSLVVDALVAEHLKVLCVASGGGLGVEEAVADRDTLIRPLLDAVHMRWGVDAHRLQNGRRYMQRLMYRARKGKKEGSKTVTRKKQGQTD